MPPRRPLNVDPSALVPRSIAAYDLLASEYYCPQKHPTCANFSALHALVLDLLRPWIQPAETYLEVGCGLGQLDIIVNPDHVVLTDVSEGMLALARARTGGRVRCERLNAFEPDLPAASLGGVGAFLADPYNHPAFYRAIRPAIKPGGFLALTLPNHSWASSLRKRLGFDMRETVFIYRGRLEVAAPSITRFSDQQAALMFSGGFETIATTTLTLGMLSESQPSHHVRFAAEELEIDPRAVPLLDFYLARTVDSP